MWNCTCNVESVVWKHFGMWRNSTGFPQLYCQIFCEKLKEFNRHIYKLITYGKYKNEGKKWSSTKMELWALGPWISVFHTFVEDGIPLSSL